MTKFLKKVYCIYCELELTDLGDELKEYHQDLRKCIFELKYFIDNLKLDVKDLEKRLYKLEYPSFY